MDIREIRLLKNFHGERSSGLLNGDAEASGCWHVFGHYDYMEITHINQSEAEHPLETILAHSYKWTFENAGSTKLHLLYGIANDENTAAAFWKESAEQPLLMVSLIHFKHPLNDFEQLVKHLENAIERTIELKQQEQGAEQNHFQLFYSSYVSIDANDLIIFWATNSIQTTMSVIASVWKQCTDKIHEFFTLIGCHETCFITEDYSNPIYQRWLVAEPALDCVRTHIRGKDFRQILKKAKEIVELVPKHPDRLQEGNKETTADYCIIPGQDDIVLYFRNLPLKLFVKMYQCPEDESPSDPLMGILGNSTEIISRSVVDTFFTASFDESDQEKEIRDGERGKKQGNCSFNNPNTRVRNHSLELYENLITTIKNDSAFPRTQWLAALYELLVELSYLETSPTAHDMYIQSYECQKILVDHIVEIIQKKKEKPERYRALTDPRSNLVACIQQYIQGWSQLSFHSMLAELQLTQISDINRMYLYPAKLNRIYTSFMQFASRILSHCDKEDNPNKEARFFLTPSMRSNEACLSIFDEYRDSFDTDALLILGEIPAEFLFSPQVLLPILVHEAAHYTGCRKRKLRYEYLAKSMIAHLVDEYVQEDVLYQNPNINGIYPFQEVVDELYERKFKQLMGDQHCYGNDVRNSLLSKLQYELQGYHIANEIFGILFSKSEYVHWNQTKKLIFKEKYLGNLDSGVRSLNTISSANNLEAHYDRLISIYREAYADMCMIKLLNLNLFEYLSIIYRSSRFNRAETIKDLQSLIQNTLRELTRYERYICVIGVAYVKDGTDFYDGMKKSLEDCIAKKYSNDLPDSVNEDDYKGIQCLAGALLQTVLNEGLHYQERGCDTTYSRHVFYYARAWIMDYLREIKALLPVDVPCLCKFYTTLASQIRNVDSTDSKTFLAFLKPCIDLTRKQT